MRLSSSSTEAQEEINDVTLAGEGNERMYEERGVGREGIHEGRLSSGVKTGVAMPVIGIGGNGRPQREGEGTGVAKPQREVPPEQRSRERDLLRRSIVKMSSKHKPCEMR